ncbi:hypothetical protein Poly41_57090 [Novipirellula artificiosorum]|uniref:Uncharacterized protein n=1 Tax=Novipirellula artificiosorum TaxID=2528016 RepID=A0A5C6D8V5_9BACT|nr:hypothetical protein Poly41_57090 [Novipirellula artificiosorum]
MHPSSYASFSSINVILSRQTVCRIDSEEFLSADARRWPNRPTLRASARRESRVFKVVALTTRHSFEVNSDERPDDAAAQPSVIQSTVRSISLPAANSITSPRVGETWEAGAKHDLNGRPTPLPPQQQN